MFTIYLQYTCCMFTINLLNTYYIYVYIYIYDKFAIDLLYLHLLIDDGMYSYNQQRWLPIY